MRELVLTPRFKRAFRKFMRQHRHLQKTIEETLIQMQSDIFAAPLHTHKLTGPLSGLRACSCGYDCRMVFSIELNKLTGKEEIFLLNIGTHEEIY